MTQYSIPVSRIAHYSILQTIDVQNPSYTILNSPVPPIHYLGVLRAGRHAQRFEVSLQPITWKENQGLAAWARCQRQRFCDHPWVRGHNNAETKLLESIPVQWIRMFLDATGKTFSTSSTSKPVVVTWPLRTYLPRYIQSPPTCQGMFRTSNITTPHIIKIP